MIYAPSKLASYTIKPMSRTRTRTSSMTGGNRYKRYCTEPYDAKMFNDSDDALECGEEEECKMQDSDCEWEEKEENFEEVGFILPSHLKILPPKFPEEVDTNRATSTLEYAFSARCTENWFLKLKKNLEQGPEQSDEASPLRESIREKLKQGESVYKVRRTLMEVLP